MLLRNRSQPNQAKANVNTQDWSIGASNRNMAISVCLQIASNLKSHWFPAKLLRDHFQGFIPQSWNKLKPRGSDPSCEAFFTMEPGSADNACKNTGSERWLKWLQELYQNRVRLCLGSKTCKMAVSEFGCFSRCSLQAGCQMIFRIKLG